MFTLFDELKFSVGKSVKAGFKIRTLGIDSWASDFGVLDSDGNLLGNPHSYFDGRTIKVADEVYARLSAYEMFKATGTEPHHRFALFQLAAMQRYESDILEKTRTMLFIPNLLGYFCTGLTSCEATQASTTLLFDPFSRDWNADMFGHFGLPNRFPPLNDSASILGSAAASLKEDTGAGNLLVVNTPQHDSAVAMLAAAGLGQDTVFINSGSWSVIGTYLDTPIVARGVYEKRFNNQMGASGRVMFVKNILGLWIWQQCLREWEAEGHRINYEELENSTASSGFDSSLDLQCDWLTTQGDMRRQIVQSCEERAWSVPQNVPQFYACILNGLSKTYKDVIADLGAITGRRFSRIRLVGGGSRSAYLCERTARETGLEVIAEPYEATAVGNIIAQLIATKEIRDETEAAEVIQNSFRMKHYS